MRVKYIDEPVSRQEFDKVMERFDSIDVQQKTTHDLLAAILDVLLETKAEATHRNIGALVKMKVRNG